MCVVCVGCVCVCWVRNEAEKCSFRIDVDVYSVYAPSPWILIFEICLLAACVVSRVRYRLDVQGTKVRWNDAIYMHRTQMNHFRQHRLLIWIIPRRRSDNFCSLHLPHAPSPLSYVLSRRGISLYFLVDVVMDACTKLIALQPLLRMQ